MAIECPSDISSYQDHIDAVDRGSFGASDFGMLNSHVAWNLSCPQLVRFGVFTKQPMKKCEFTCIAAESFMNFVASLDEDRQRDKQKMVPFIMDTRIKGHTHKIGIIDDLHQKRGVKQVHLSCVLCSVEETAMGSLGMKPPCMFSLKQQGMAYCKECNMVAHVTVPTTKLNYYKDW
eukprot:11678704-Ditylum_brightwellii.AAC.1